MAGVYNHTTFTTPHRHLTVRNRDIIIITKITLIKLITQDIPSKSRTNPITRINNTKTNHNNNSYLCKATTPNYPKTDHNSPNLTTLSSHHPPPKISNKRDLILDSLLSNSTVLHCVSS